MQKFSFNFKTITGFFCFIFLFSALSFHSATAAVPERLVEIVTNSDAGQLSIELEDLRTRGLNIPEFISEGIPSSNDTLLHLAARRGDVKIITILIREGADLNSVNAYGYTPIHLARDLNSVRTLIEAGARGDAPAGTHRATMLHLIIYSLNFAKVGISHLDIALISYLCGRYPNLVNTQDLQGRTPARFAAFSQQEVLFELLVQLGAYPEPGNSEGNPPSIRPVDPSLLAESDLDSDPSELDLALRNLGFRTVTESIPYPNPDSGLAAIPLVKSEPNTSSDDIDLAFEALATRARQHLFSSFEDSSEASSLDFSGAAADERQGIPQARETIRALRRVVLPVRSEHLEPEPTPSTSPAQTLTLPPIDRKRGASVTNANSQ
jgi:ankyrin repeat protein